jgi:hypothetical protein
MTETEMLSLTVVPSRHSEPGRVDALYLFACAVAWRRSGNVYAGWELVRALMSPDSAAARLLAATLLSRTGKSP